MQILKTSFFRALGVAIATGSALAVPNVHSAEISTYYQDSFPKFIKSDAAVSGLCMDMIKAVEAKTGDVVVNDNTGNNRFRSLKRIEAELVEGNADVFFCMAKNERREAMFDYVATPLYEVNHVVAVRKGEHSNVKTFDDIRQLSDVSVMTNSGTATERYLIKQGGMNVDAGAEALDQNIKKLLADRGDFVYFHDIGLYSRLAESFSGAPLDVLPTSFRKYHHYLVVSRKAPAGLKERLEKAVAELEADGTLAEIANRYRTVQN